MAAQKLTPPYRRPRLYAASLLQEARRLRLIEGRVLTAADRAFSALALARRKSKRDSLTECEASARYLVGLYLRSLPSHTHALQALCDALENDSLATLLEKGQALLRRRFLLAASRYALTKQTMLPLPNLAYQRTLNEQIPAFLCRLDANKNAHCEDFSLSYPLCEPVRNLSGLSRILRYLHGLYHENRFLAQFPYEEIEYLYLSYCFSGRFYDVEAPLINLYRMVLQNAILCEYLQVDSPSLLLSKKEISTAEQILSTLSGDEQEQILLSCANRLFATATPYYTRTAATTVKTLVNAIHNRALARVLVTEDSEGGAL